MGRLPERDTRAGAHKTGRFSWRPSNVLIALIFILIFTIGPYLAFTGHVPFTGFPWGKVAFALIDTPLAPYVRWVGVPALSGLVVLLAAGPGRSG